MATRSKKADVDAMLTYMLLKKMMTSIINMPAYKMKLIDSTGRIVKEPTTAQEKDSLTLLDRIVLKLKRLLGPRMASFFNFLYLQTLNQRMYNNLIVQSSVQQKAEVKRVSKDIKRYMESINISMDDMVYFLIEEDLSNPENKVLFE